MKVKMTKKVGAALAFVVGWLAGSVSAAVTQTAAMLAEFLPSGTPVYLETDDDSQLVIVLSGDITGGLTIPADLGPVEIDLNGWLIKGSDGADGTSKTAGENGGAAITVAGVCGADADTTAITVKDERCNGVQLWADGPIFAECNLGATKPEEVGWFFWWGDTVGYTHDGSKWASVADGTTAITFDNTDPANSTYGKSVSELTPLGYIDDENNPVLNLAHDAARAHLGAPWRMMTGEELQKLADPAYCTCTWTDDYNETGVSGYMITGVQELFRNNKIFIPAAGRGDGALFCRSTEKGRYWSSGARAVAVRPVFEGIGPFLFA